MSCHIKTDSIGRYRVYLYDSVSIDEFVGYCNKASDFVSENAGYSRWSVRGIVEPVSGDLEDSLRCFSGLEINKFDISHQGIRRSFLWVSKNYGHRIPPQEEQELLYKIINDREEYQKKYAGNHYDETMKVIDAAKRNKLALVCVDPMKEWGSNLICKSSFSALMKSYFYSTTDECNNILSGQGYSLWHYTFGINDSQGNLLGIFVWARWPWGFEGTYGMIRPNRDSTKFRVLKLLMLLSSALLLDRHGDSHLIYGESNQSSLRAGIEAGYKIILPSKCVENGNHYNVVWSDNPMGIYDKKYLDDPLLDPIPPAHIDKQYASYAIMQLSDISQVSPFIEHAYDFLQTS